MNKIEEIREALDGFPLYGEIKAMASYLLTELEAKDNYEKCVLHDIKWRKEDRDICPECARQIDSEAKD